MKTLTIALNDEEEKAILEYLLPKSKILDTPEMDTLDGILLRVWQSAQRNQVKTGEGE